MTDRTTIEVTPRAFQTIMAERSKALLLVDDDIPDPADVMRINMAGDDIPYLQVRVTCVEEFDLEDGPWHFVLNARTPERVALVSFNLGLEL